MLLSPTGAAKPYFAEFGWVVRRQEHQAAGADDAMDGARRRRSTPSTPVTLTWDNGAGLALHPHDLGRRQYMFTVEETVENHRRTPVTLYPYGLIARLGTPPIRPITSSIRARSACSTARCRR